MDLEAFAMRSAWIGGGVIGLIALAAGDLGAYLYEHGCRPLAATVLSLVVVAGGLTAFARVEFVWAKEKLDLHMASNGIDATAALDNTAPQWPDKTQRLYEAALVAVALAGLGFVVLLWTAV